MQLNLGAQQNQQVQQQQQQSNQKPPLPASAPKPKKSQTTGGTGTKKKKKAPTAAGIVSASDTDGELSSRGAKSKSLSASVLGQSRKRKPPEPIDTSNMTPTEKAKANRDRNREHARNTRLRKKAYLERLKTTVDDLCKERDTLVSERAGSANLLVEMHNTRTEVLMSFFALRSTNEKRRNLWASILDESCFNCVIPVTPYRSFPASEVQVSKCQRTVMGIDGMMADTASLHVLLSSLVDRSRFPNGKIEFCYTLVTEEAVVAGNQIMARWVMSTLNATQLGAGMEVSKQGMLCCKFNSAHRITGLELMFDVMALMLQMKQAAGSDSFSVIPNTVQACQRSFDKPMVMTLAEGPYTIIQVNQLWENMTGYTAEDVVGKTSCSILQGPLTEKSSLHDLMNEVRFKRAASVMLLNYKKNGEKFRNFIVVYPLSTDSRITHYLALTTYVERVEGEGTEAAPAMQPQHAVGSNSGGFNTSSMSSQQMQQIMKSQTQLLQNQQPSSNSDQQDQVAASVAMLQSNMLSAANQGQMLPPSNSASNNMQYSVQNIQEQQQQQNRPSQPPKQGSCNNDAEV